MTLEEYQKEALKTATYPNIGDNLIYPLFGLCGEVGEVANKYAKVIRDKDGILDDESKIKLMDELSDVAWFFVICCHELHISPSKVLQHNIDKLKSRKERGVLRGSGDNR